MPTPRDDYRGTLVAIRDLVASLESEASARCRVGVGTPGALSPATGRIKNANSTWLNGKPLDVDLCEALGREVGLANDADCFALSEATDGAAADAPVVFGVILGTGVGAGLVVDRKLVRGPNAISGEWGHNPLPSPRDDERPGRLCYCGRYGCIETFLSGPAMAADHGGNLDARAIAESDTPEAKQTLERYIDRLARALASVINIVDPHTIVLGGGLSQIDRLYEQVPQLWGDYVFSDAVATRLVAPRHGDSSGVRGAAWL